MISTKLRSYELVGRKVILERDIQNGAGLGISKGSIATIHSARYGVTIKTEKCPHCGQFAWISKVSRNDLTLIK